MSITVHCPIEECQGDIELDINVTSGQAATFSDPEDPSEAELIDPIPTVCPHCSFEYKAEETKHLNEQVGDALKIIERNTPLRGTAAYRSARRLERYEHDVDDI